MKSFLPAIKTFSTQTRNSIGNSLIPKITGQISDFDFRLKDIPSVFRRKVKASLDLRSHLFIKNLAKIRRRQW
jgi:hypothetical protein